MGNMGIAEWEILQGRVSLPRCNPTEKETARLWQRAF
jgi:hypothetical protein